MTPIVSTLTVYDTATGAFAVNAPDGVELREGQATKPLPADFDWTIYRWDEALPGMVVRLDAVRARHWLAVRTARDVAKAGGTDTPFGRVDTTQDSLILANGASSTAMAAKSMGQPFQTGWTMADNTTVTLDGDQMILLGVMISRHIGACHAEGVARRAAIDAATDKAAIEAVPVNGGWPGAPA